MRLELQGLMGRHVDVSASAGYVLGRSALSLDSQRFDAYTGTVRGRYAVARSVALYTEYLYYYYDLHRLQALTLGLPPIYEQHGVRVGLMLWNRAVGR
jgi:hypothetical protein